MWRGMHFLSLDRPHLGPTMFRTSLSSSLRRHGRTFSGGAGWPAPVDRAVGPVGQRQCGDLSLGFPLASGHVLHDLLLADAHLGEVF